MSTRTNEYVSLVALLPFIGILGCGKRSHVYVAHVGVQYDLRKVFVQEDESGKGKIYWGFGDNREAFRPALYAPYPGPSKEWCLYIATADDKEGRLVFVTCSPQIPPGVRLKAGENIAVDAYYAPRVELTAKAKDINGEGEAICQEYEIQEGLIVPQRIPEWRAKIIPVSAGISFKLKPERRFASLEDLKVEWNVRNFHRIILRVLEERTTPATLNAGN